jgi:cysteine synthase A
VRAVYAALELAKELGSGKKVVTLARTFGERYLSTDLFRSEVPPEGPRREPG